MQYPVCWSAEEYLHRLQVADHMVHPRVASSMSLDVVWIRPVREALGNRGSCRVAIFIGNSMLVLGSKCLSLPVLSHFLKP